MNSQLLILGLHRIGFPPPDARIRGLFTSPRLLAFEISLLQKAGYRFTTLSEAFSKPNGKTAVLTFDDGYADNLALALPILRKFQAPATVFVITEDVGRKNVVWQEAGEKLPSDMLSWNELAELQQEGWEVGSHAHRHIHLARYDEKEQEKAICRSIEEIKKNLGSTPVSFAYPYGSYNEKTKEILKGNGIRYAVTTKPARRDDRWHEADLLELSRCSIGGRSFHHYVKSLSKTKKAIGLAQPVRGLSNHFFQSLAAKFQPEKPIILSLGAANNNVVTRQ